MIRDQVAQLLMCGFQDEKHLDQLIELGVGGYILFQRNCKNLEGVKYYTKKIKEQSKGPAWISIDQEGGSITRIKEGLSLVPSQMAIAATGKPIYAYDVACTLAHELSDLGINMNLAPVVDINSNPKNPVINIRSFSSHVDCVVDFSLASLKGYQNSSVMAVAKHFPGHGDTTLDSHKALPTLNFTLDRLNSVELVPYKKMIAKGLKAIMVSHVLYKQIDRKYPSSLSANMIHLLRQEMSFKGIIMTDCMEMDAIQNNYSVEEAAVQSILAGVDIILYSHSYETQLKALNGLVEAVEKGHIEIGLIEEKIKRIQDYRQSHKDCNHKYKSSNIDQVFQESITCLNDQITEVHLKECLFVMPEKPFIEKYNLNLKTYNNHDELASILTNLKDHYQYIFLGCYKLKDVKIMESICQLNANKFVLIALESPYDLRLIDPKFTSYYLYGYSEKSMDAFIKLLEGHSKAQGILPISFKENIND